MMSWDPDGLVWIALWFAPPLVAIAVGAVLAKRESKSARVMGALFLMVGLLGAVAMAAGG
jgi:hypothetical protein